MVYSVCDNEPWGSQTSSSRRDGTPTPEDQVAELVEKYGRHNSLSPILHEPLRKPEQISQFLEVFERHLLIVKSRSQAFEDGHITIYDKALLSLTQNGSDLHNVGALGLYLDEVVGIGRGESLEQMGEVLNKHIKVHALLGQGKPLSGLFFVWLSLLIYAFAQPASESTKNREKKRHNCVSALTNGDSKANIQRPRQPKGLNLTEDKLSRILAVYAKAKADYISIYESNPEVKSRAAKFLRDTAENTLLYIKAQKSDHRLIPELESTREMAKNKAITLCGGRKRRFEVCEMDNVQGVPRSPKRAMARKHYQRDNAHYGGRSREFYHGSSNYSGNGRRRADCYRPDE